MNIKLNVGNGKRLDFPIHSMSQVHAFRPLYSKIRPGPTRCFYGMADFVGPADLVQEGAPHVAPKVRHRVFGCITLVLIHQPQAPTDNRFNDGHAGPTHILGVDNLHTHACSERGLHVLCQLRREWTIQ